MDNNNPAFLTRRGFVKGAGVLGALMTAEVSQGVEDASLQAHSEDESKGVTRQLAEFIVLSKPDDVTDTARKEAIRSILNYVGCAVGGSQHETMRCAIKALSPFWGAEQATLLGRPEKVDILHAALLNGIASHVLDFDDTQLSTIIHPAGPVASAVLPLAQWRGHRGREVLHAFILGVEVECRVGKCVYPSHYHAGWHITGTAGVFGAAAAAGKLLGLDAGQMCWALGLAATQSSGFKEMFGTMTKSYHPGHAARCGLSAALLAAQDYTSTEAAIEAPQGFAHVMSPERDFSEITRSLGETWEVSENTYKPFACGIVVHPVIDACRQLREEHQLHPDSIVGVELRVNPYVLSLTGKKTPKTGLEAKFSVYHSVAVAILFGEASPRQYMDKRVSDPKVVALRERVHATAVEAISEEQAEVVVLMKDGTRLEKRVQHALGSLQNPMTNEQLESKFRALAEGILPDAQANRLIQQCWQLESLANIGDLVKFGSTS